MEEEDPDLSSSSALEPRTHPSADYRSHGRHNALFTPEVACSCYFSRGHSFITEILFHVRTTLVPVRSTVTLDTSTR